ncbi:MAG: 50S ribosomal protein L30 [Pseudomonadota bacterium]|uniref:50S ribosomal protein L30 n=1 Tax=Thermithiobacillus tepidarius TaxID=929 RepID=UPI000405E7CF|nr:50S ribosomal protein L30 [Thermithiobacillus tepidarius]
MANSNKLKITLVRSPIATPKQHRQTLRGLGLRRMHHSVELPNTPEIRGMVTKINYMLKCEEL